MIEQQQQIPIGWQQFGQVRQAPQQWFYGAANFNSRIQNQQRPETGRRSNHTRVPEGGSMIGQVDANGATHVESEHQLADEVFYQTPPFYGHPSPIGPAQVFYYPISPHYYQYPIQQQQQQTQQQQPLARHQSHQIHPRSRGRGTNSMRGGHQFQYARGGAHHFDRQASFNNFYPDQSQQQMYYHQMQQNAQISNYQSQQQKTRRNQGGAGYVIHRRQFGGGTSYPEGPGNNEQDSIQPLTQASRVHRRGRGGGPRQTEEGTPTEGEEEDQSTMARRKKRGGGPDNSATHHKIVHRAGGRGQRGRPDDEHRELYGQHIPSRGGYSGAGGSRGGPNGRGHGQNHYHPQYQNRDSAQDYYSRQQRPSHHHSSQQQQYQQYYQTPQHHQSKRGQPMHYHNSGGSGSYHHQSSGQEKVVQHQIRKRGGGQSHQEEMQEYYDELEHEYIPEYERYGDYEDSTVYSQQPKSNIKYRLKTFGDERESDVSSEADEENNGQNRRGPKLIKFKQKKPSERLALSQLKSEQDDKKDILDLYTPQNTQKTNKVQILKPYVGFEQPEFFQGPQWKFIRQSTNQNSKQKHFEKGEYDKVQYNFPGAELEDKETTDGETKLYPPIDDFSDEDVNIAPSSSNLRAKISFNKSTSDSEKNRPLPQNLQNLQINIMPSTFQTKKQKPTLQAKTYTFDQKKPAAITMEGAEKFFIEETESPEKRDTQYFEKHESEAAVIEEKKAKGLMFEGIVRINPKFRHRAYVSIQELDVDMLVEGYKLMNRALDGDTVLIELLPVHSWIEMSDQNTLQAKVTTLCQTTGQQQFGMSHLRKVDDQAYTNEAAIEKRVVDNKIDDHLSQSHSQSEDEQSQSNILNKLKPKKFMRNTEEDGEGYIASNSDNNVDRKVVKKKRAVQEQSTNKIILSEENAEDLWEHLEVKARYGEEISASLSDPETPSIQAVEQKSAVKKSKGAMTIAEFLGQEKDEPEVKQSSYNRKELSGTKDERVDQINQYGLKLRPLAKIVGLTTSPNRQQNQMVTLVEIEKTPISNNNEQQSKSLLFAVPVNQKLPWFIVSLTPKEFIDDKNRERNPSHRYYIVRYDDWAITQKRPHCTVLESIGEAGNLEAESLRLLKMHDICTDKYEPNEQADPTLNVHECLKVFARDIDPVTKEWQIPQKEIEARMDLRKKRIFTIDPLTARDLDDALSIEKITDKIYEIGVHIADVSYFVQQGSDLDKEAQKRCTSTYFVHRVYPMLPRLLCERLCSLNPNVDRLTYSVFFRMDIGTGQVVKDFEPVFARSVINSCAKWNYQLAQDILSGKVTSEDQLPQSMKPKGQNFLDMAQDILLMNSIAQARRKKRFEAGSLVFHNREFNFTLNPKTNYPLTYQESGRMQSKQLVEEFMLLANILTAEFIHKYCKDKTILRAHEDVKPDRKSNLRNFFQKIEGLENIDMTNNLTLSNSMKEIEQQTNSEDKLMVLNRKFLQNLQQAKYVCVENLDEEEYSHYGLNFALYTHFTSPIRRYADLLVHRLLTICLKEKDNTRAKIDGIDYAEYAELVSKKSFNARKASKECVSLFHCLLIKEHGKRVYETLIYDVDSNQISIYIQELNMTYSVRLRDDRRVDQTTFFEDVLQVACNFRSPQMLAPGLKDYQGFEELKRSNWLKNKEKEMERMEEEKRDLQRRLQTQNTEPVASSSTVLDSDVNKQKDLFSNNCVFSVLDKVKVKVETTESFPLELVCTLLITQEDMIEYELILAEQQQKQQEIDELVSQAHFMQDDTPVQEEF